MNKKLYRFHIYFVLCIIKYVLFYGMYHQRVYKVRFEMKKHIKDSCDNKNN